MSMLTDKVVAEDHVLGNDDARYTLVEYGDLQCPDTATAEPEIGEVSERYQGQFRLVYRHFPLADIHPYAYQSALAVEAASRQGKFWEMRAQLLERQDHLTSQDILEHAAKIGLNVDQFKVDLADRQLARKVDTDIQTGTRSGVDSTPTFFLNGKMLDPGLELFEAFESMSNKDDSGTDLDPEDDEKDDDDDAEDEEDDEEY